MISAQHCYVNHHTCLLPIRLFSLCPPVFRHNHALTLVQLLDVPSISAPSCLVCCTWACPPPKLIIYYRSSEGPLRILGFLLFPSRRGWELELHATSFSGNNPLLLDDVGSFTTTSQPLQMGDPVLFAIPEMALGFGFVTPRERLVSELPCHVPNAELLSHNSIS